MEHDPHTGFIVAAYVISAMVIVSMIVVIVTDGQALRHALLRFGTRGLDRE